MTIQFRRKDFSPPLIDLASEDEEPDWWALLDQSKSVEEYEVNLENLRQYLVKERKRLGIPEWEYQDAVGWIE